MTHDIGLYLFYFGLVIFAIFGIAGIEKDDWGYRTVAFVALLIAFVAGLVVVTHGGF